MISFLASKNRRKSKSRTFYTKKSFSPYPDELMQNDEKQISFFLSKSLWRLGRRKNISGIMTPLKALYLVMLPSNLALPFELKALKLHFFKKLYLKSFGLWLVLTLGQCKKLWDIVT